MLQKLREEILAPKKQKFDNTRECLRNVCSSMADNEISQEKFLINIGHCIHKRKKYKQINNSKLYNTLIF